MNTETTPNVQTLDTPAPAPAAPVTLDAPPLTNAEINMGLPTNNAAEQLANRPPPPLPQVLPTLPRTTALLASETHAREVLEASGPMGDREGAILTAIGVQDRMARALEALEKARQTHNPKDTASQHLDRVHRAYQTLLTNAAREHDVAKARIGERRRELERQIDAQIGMTPSADAAEIRSALRNMSSEERGKAIQAAIDNRDGSVLHAVFTGRELTTGVTAAQQKSFRRRAEERYCGDLAGLRAGLDKAEALVSRAFDDLADLEPKVKGPPAVVSEFERRTAESDAAWLAFGRAMSGGE